VIIKVKTNLRIKECLSIKNIKTKTKNGIQALKRNIV
jgi:hypothetical protein